MADHDYDEITEKTIDEIKEMVKEEDLDLKKLLKAEKDNKDRKTLKEWLNRQIESQDSGKQDAEHDEKGDEKTARDTTVGTTPSGPGTAPSSLWKRPKTVFLIGLVVGLVLGASVIYTTGPQPATAVTETEAAQQADAYFEEQLGGIVPANISVASVDSTSYPDLYVLTMNVQTENQTAQRDVYMTKQSGLLFINSLFGGIPAIDAETQEPVGSAQVPAGQQ